MSSSAEQSPELVEGQESRVDSMVAKALEAARNPFLREIGERFQKEPNQMVKLSEILGFSNEEEKITKALVWLKKNAPEKYQAVLQFSEAKNEKRRKKMKVEWGETHYSRMGIPLVKKLMEKAIKKEEVKISRVEDHEATYACLKSKDKIGNYDYVVAIMSNSRKFFMKLGYSDITIYVLGEKYLRLAERFARLYEKKTGKESVIYQEY